MSYLSYSYCTNWDVETFSNKLEKYYFRLNVSFVKPNCFFCSLQSSELTELKRIHGMISDRLFLPQARIFDMKLNLN